MVMAAVSANTIVNLANFFMIIIYLLSVFDL